MLSEGCKNPFVNALDGADALISWGFRNQECNLTGALMVGMLKAPTYVELMDWQADIAQQHLDTTGQITVMFKWYCYRAIYPLHF
jgi:hypothetical protein